MSNGNRRNDKSTEDLEKAQDNQKNAERNNNPQSETGPAENLRAKAAEAEEEDSSRDAT